MLGADGPVYATPLENLRAAQAAAEELMGWELMSSLTGQGESSS